jgi:deazaflavin-dependent oxidoreductase (nitroreductase family)
MGRRAPRWLKVVNPINRFLLSKGIGPAPQHLLSIVGRRTGRVRTTPVAVVTLDGGRYVVAGFDGSDWVSNARAAGTAQLHRGLRRENVVLTEVPLVRRGPILRAFATRVRGGQPFLGVPASASDAVFAEAGARHPVFRLDPASPSG